MRRLMFRCLLLFWSRLLAADGEALLSDKAVWMIVMSTPEGLELEARRGCPSVEVVPEGKVLVSVQLRNSCPVSGNGMVDNFTVDLRTGRIWTGVDVRKYIDSERLRRLRDLLGRN